jgi:hypothetical protein
VYGSPSSTSGSSRFPTSICRRSSATSSRKISPAEAVAVATVATMTTHAIAKRCQNFAGASSYSTSRIVLAMASISVSSIVFESVLFSQ